MKKLLFAVAAIMMVVGASAQSENQEKKFWVGGSFSLSGQEAETNTLKTFEFSPEFGYNLNNRWALALGLNYGYAKTEQSNNTTKINTFGFSPFARYTALRWKAISLFVDGGLRFATGYSETTSGHSTLSESDTFGIGAFVDPGISVNLCKGFSLVGRANLFNFAYQSEKENATDSEKSAWTSSLNSPFNAENVTFGFEFKF
jgi:hypothetical protein